MAGAMNVRPDRQQRVLRLVERTSRAAVEAGLSRVRIDNHAYDGSTIEVDGESLINFNSCAYLGLDVDPRLKAGAIDAVERYGPVYSSSAVYTSVPLYDELESLLRRMFSANVIPMATTTLSHMAFFQVGFRPDDVILADRQVHATVQLAGELLQAHGHTIQLLAHNDMAELERAVTRASETAEPRIHLDPELTRRQQELARRIAWVNRLIETLELRSPGTSDSPIFFVEIGSIHRAIEVVTRLKGAGYFTNFAAFPAVPLRRAGLRFAVTLHHSLEQIESMMTLLAAAAFKRFET